LFYCNELQRSQMPRGALHQGS